MVIPKLEKAVQTLLKPPHIHYLKELHSAAQADSNYIFNKEATLGAKVQTILVNEGVPWKPEELQRLWARILGIALHRIEAK